MAEKRGVFGLLGKVASWGGGAIAGLAAGYGVDQWFGGHLTSSVPKLARPIIGAQSDIQAANAGLDAMNAGEFKLGGILGVLQAVFRAIGWEGGVEWTEKQFNKIQESTKERSARVAESGELDGAEKKALGITAGVGATAALGIGGIAGIKAYRGRNNGDSGDHNNGGDGNAKRSNNQSTQVRESRADFEAAKSNGQSDLFGETNSRNAKTPRLGGNKLMKSFGGLTRLKNALFGGAAVTAAGVGVANAGEATEAYTAGDMAVDAASVVAPVVADIADVVELSAQGEFSAAAEVGTVAAGGALTAAFASAGAGALMGTVAPGAGNIVGGVVGFAAGLGGYYLGSMAVSSLFNGAASNDIEAAPTALATQTTFRNTGPAAMFD